MKQYDLKNINLGARIIGTVICLIFLAVPIRAQIGYQVSLLNRATGEPRANITVNATVTITDVKGGTVFTGMQRATSNDFGVLSLVVGDANTFQNVDTGKLPLYISVSVDGVLIGKTQILNVPVAEIANRVKSSFTKEDLVGTWKEVDLEYHNDYTYIFNSDGTMKGLSWTHDSETGQQNLYDSFSATYEIDGNNIYVFVSPSTDLYSRTSNKILRWRKGKLYFADGSKAFFLKE